MPTFKDNRKALRKAQAELDKVQSFAVTSNETLKRIEQARTTALRTTPIKKHKETAKNVDKQLKDLKAKRLGALKSFDKALKDRDLALDGFLKGASPEEMLGELSDSTPIALLPLRLETRYKTISTVGQVQFQLWVRVYPDDLLVDGFQPEISRAEYANVRLYWINNWSAVADSAKKKAAFVSLARAHGSGRARWLIEKVEPINPEDSPEKVDEGNATLIIQPTIAIDKEREKALRIFWLQVWESGGEAWIDSMNDLAGKFGAESAADMVKAATPINFQTMLASSIPAPGAKIFFLRLPLEEKLNVSQSDWTRGARLGPMPERLVLMGFRDDAQVLREVGKAIPPGLGIGPDPSLADKDQITADGADLNSTASKDWAVDFDQAVANGMGFRVTLPFTSAEHRFDRLFVLGVRAADTAVEGATAVENLIEHHQASRKGFSLLRQGQPTNNTDSASAGYSWWEDHDAAYDAFTENSKVDQSDWRARTDGDWLARLLGLSTSQLRASPGYQGTDQSEARAMNEALYPATLGYYMQEMMSEVFTETAQAQTRDFFNRHVIGRGPLPLVRVGKQPYGILPATAWSRTAFWKQRRYGNVAKEFNLPPASFIAQVKDVVAVAANTWEALQARVSHLGEPGDDPQATLLHILGLHPTSSEFYQRYSQSFTQHFNFLSYSLEPVSEPLTAAGRRYIEAGLLALSELGWTMPPNGGLPELLEKIFLEEPNLLQGDLVAPVLSETDSMPVRRTDGLNDLEWLANAARKDHDTLRSQAGFDDALPSEMLYLMLHHALDLGYVDSAINLRRDALNWSPSVTQAARKDANFIGVETNRAVESKWASLYRVDPEVTGNNSIQLGQYIPTVLNNDSVKLGQQLAALDRLKKMPTARLERTFVEHLDCLSYRLDAWRLAMASVQLAYMREDAPGRKPKRGLFLGAYGWVENLAPGNKKREKVKLKNELAEAFKTDFTEEIFADSDNRGHIHAPSLDHAVTAAILRNGYLANATPLTPDLLAVDLSSERVRLAQSTIEGLRRGQSLGALLGYQLERGLHDESGVFLDSLIYELRSRFPLIGNLNRKTRLDTLSDIRKAESRNVVDGLAFINHVMETGSDSYPFGLSGLPALTDFVRTTTTISPAQVGVLIDAQVNKVRMIGDAVGDLGIAEGVHQVVRGNFDRAAGNLEAYSKGHYPPEAQVVATPSQGPTITHRVALHLQGGLAAPGSTPREKIEPALATWVANHLPAMQRIRARIAWTNGDDSEGSLAVSMADIGITPVDLFFLIGSDGERELTGFDDLLIDHAEQNDTPHHDAVFVLELHPASTVAPDATLFEIAPLVRALRGTILGARHLKPTHLSRSQDAAAIDDAAIVPRPDKPLAIRDDLAATIGTISTQISLLLPLIGPEVDTNAAQAVASANIDNWLQSDAVIARSLTPYGLRSASLTAAVEARRRPFTLMREMLVSIETNLLEKQMAFDNVMAEYAALDTTVDDKTRREKLLRACRTVSTKLVNPEPPNLIDYEALVSTRKLEFDAMLDSIGGLQSHQTVGTLFTAIESALPELIAVTLQAWPLDEIEAAILAVAQKLLVQAQQALSDIEGRIARADAALALTAELVGEAAQTHVEAAAKALLGEATLVLPDIVLGFAQQIEWENGWADRDSILKHLTTVPGGEFALDDWLHGLARVRPKMGHLETVQHLAPVMGAKDAASLAALQFPFRANDVWLGDRFPANFRDGQPFVLESGKLLYTVLAAQGSEISVDDTNQVISGLLIDEWSEVIPKSIATTGLAFHSDRPNTEAPQAVLLVTPPRQQGKWFWNDVVDAMHETLDFAGMRAVEPEHVGKTAIAPLLPAVLSAVSSSPITSALNFSENNNLSAALKAISDD